MAAPMAHTAMASLAVSAGARPFATKPPMAAPALTPRRRALVVRASQNENKDKVSRTGGRLLDVFKFWGPAPERINGRLAMVGFVWALAVEATRGDGLIAQATSGPGRALFVVTVALMTAASLVPLLKGESPEEAEDRSDGTMTADAEIWNGRLAMLGLVALAATEFLKGTPLINL